MEKDSFLNEEKIESCLKKLKEKVNVPEDFYIYPFFVNKSDELCFINVEGEETLKITFRKSNSTKTIKNIKNYKRIYLLIPHRIKILKIGGKTFMDVSKSEDLKEEGHSLQIKCKLFKKINSIEIYICHIRSNMTCSELIEFVKEKLKEYRNIKRKIKYENREDEKEVEHSSKKLTFVIADKERGSYEFIEVTEKVYLVFPDFSEDFIEHLINFLKERNITSVEVVSHGRNRIKKILEAEDINVEFYDITSTVKELYQRYRKLEEVYENPGEFLRTLSEIKELFRRTISTPLILKKLAHRFSGQIANLSITLELYRIGRESSSDVVSTLEHVREALFSAKDELKRIKTSLGDSCLSEKIKEMEGKLNLVEKKITFDWEKLLEEVVNDLREIVKSIKNLMEGEEGDENTINR